MRMVHDVHDDPRLTAVLASAMVTALESRPMRTMHDDPSLRSHWLASKRPVIRPPYVPPPPRNFFEQRNN